MAFYNNSLSFLACTALVSTIHLLQLLQNFWRRACQQTELECEAPRRSPLMVQLKQEDSLKFKMLLSYHAWDLE